MPLPLLLFLIWVFRKIIKMKFTELTTERLILRMLTPDVFDFIFKNYTEDELVEFFGLSSSDELAKEKDKYAKGHTMYNKSMLGFHLMDKATRKVIGLCGFHTWYIEHNRAEIGYGLYDDSFKGKGFMSEAIVPIVEYGFKVMKLHRMEALISPDNTASLKLVGKLGFVKEGQLREHYYVNDQMVDSVVFSLLRREYISKLT